METILEFKNISYNYSNHLILDNTSISFNKGQTYAILGQSGSGKTTSLSLAGGLDKPKSGQILFNGEDISKIGLNKYRKQFVSIVFQSYNLIHYLNAYQNVITAFDISKIKVKDKKSKSIEILKSLGLNDDECIRDVRKLSGGQMQRVAIARAIAKDVDLILCDEPTGNLDDDTSNDIINTFINLAHKDNKCVIIVTHSKSLASKMDYQIEIKDKKLQYIKS